jgi:hypothetical protein
MAVVVALATTYLEADAASVTFSSIPSSYDHLQLRASIRSTDSGSGGYSGNLKCRLNSHTTGYWNQFMQGGDFNYAGSVSASAWASGSADDYMNVAYGPTSMSYGPVFGSVVIDILDYANTNKNTTLLSFSGYGQGLGEDTEADGDGGPSVNLANNLADYTPAIHTIFLYGHTNFVRGSEFSLYGLKAAN